MKTIITIITGAIIGYITNWLAIKMLFRPYKEKRILGIKVPFTPGLVPKEKSRIAKSVGETVGKHLLNKQTIIKCLSSDKINKRLESWTFNKVDLIMKSDKTIKQDIACFIGEENTNKFLNKLSKNISDDILLQLKSEDVKQIIFKQFKFYVNNFLKTDFKSIIQTEGFLSLKIKFNEFILKYKDTAKATQNTEVLINKQLDKIANENKPIKEILGSELLNIFKECINQNKNYICSFIIKTLNNDKTEEKINLIVEDTIKEKLSPMIAMFINKENLSNKIINILNEYINKESSKDYIIECLKEILDDIFNKNINEVFSTSGDNKIKLVNIASKYILQEFITTENIEDVEKTLNENTKDIANIECILNKIDCEYNDKIDSFINKKIDEFINNDSIYNLIYDIINKLINNIINKKLKYFIKDEDLIKNYVYKIIKKLYDKFIQNEAESVVDALDIASITEQKINSFDVAFAEKLIVEIANKELNAITWLGGILGAIMGLVSSLIAHVI